MLFNILLSALFLVLFAIVGTGGVALVHQATAERIVANQRQALLDRLNTIVPAGHYDNDLGSDTLTLLAPNLGGDQPVIVYRARQGGKPVAAILAASAMQGYSGPIRLLVGIYTDGTLAGVRVVAHNETPGLGDGIEAERSDWIRQFTGLSLTNPPVERWAVKRDGGQFDQFTGATITPRAVVQAIKQCLLYFATHRDELFAPTTNNPQAEKPQ